MTIAFQWCSWGVLDPAPAPEFACVAWTILEPPEVRKVPNASGGLPGVNWTVTLGPPPDPHPDLYDSVRLVWWYRDPADNVLSQVTDGRDRPAGSGPVELSGFTAWETADEDIVELLGIQVVSTTLLTHPPGRTFDLRDDGDPTKLGGVTWPEAGSFYFGEKIATDAATDQDEPAGPHPYDPEPETDVEGYVIDQPRSDALVSWTLTHGRQNANDRTEPITATVVLAAALAGDCPASGDRVRLQVDEDGEVSPRFTGEVTDPVIDPKARTYTLTCVGRLGRANRAPIDGRGWPVEDDGDRVERILTEAAPDVVLDIDPGTDDLVRPSGPASAGSLLDLVSDSTLGVVVEHPDGVVSWYDAEHRRGAVSVLELDDREILNTLVWAQRIGDVVNDATIAYGYGNAGTVRVTDPHSIDDREPFPTTITTALTDQSEAQSLGSLIVGRRSEPVWQLPQLVVDLTRRNDGEDLGVTPAKRAALLDLRHADRLTITGLPEGSPYAVSTEVYLEGYTETAVRLRGSGPTPGPLVWQLALSVSDPLLSGVTLRWLDVDPALTWRDVDPALTWLDLARMEDPAGLGDPGTGDPDVLDGGNATTVPASYIDGGDATAPPTDTYDGGHAA